MNAVPEPRGGHNPEPDREGMYAFAPELTAVFLDLDHRQTVAEAAVATHSSLHRDSPIHDEWVRVREECYSAAAAYMSLSSENSDPPPSPKEVHRRLQNAAAAVDRFYQRHRLELGKTEAEAKAVMTEAGASLRAATVMHGRMIESSTEYHSYPSVEAANRAMEVSLKALEAAMAGSKLDETRTATDWLKIALNKMEQALDGAPRRKEEAQRAVSSVRTRLEAARTRAGELPEVVSALLREFRAESSVDIVSNEQLSGSHLDSAEASLREAVAAAREDRPETALAATTKAREHIKEAENLIDAPGERLNALRRVRENPTTLEDEVRFKVRDAQRLAFDLAASDEWGSALDAQVQRIDRVVTALDIPHPDYWKYQNDLQDIARFVTNIVARIRQR